MKQANVNNKSKATTVKTLLVAAATIYFEYLLLRPLFEGGYYCNILKKLREIEPKMDYFGHFTLLLSLCRANAATI